MPTSADTSERRHNILRTRREWSLAEKLAIVAASRMPGANVSAISRRHGAAQSLIYQWRQQFPASGAGPAFFPVAITAATPVPDMPPQTAKPATVEIELTSGRKLRVATDIDAADLKRIVAALEAP